MLMRNGSDGIDTLVEGVHSVAHSGNPKTPHLAPSDTMVAAGQDQHQLTSIASFGQIQHHRIKSLQSSKQYETNKDNFNRMDS